MSMKHSRDTTILELKATLTDRQTEWKRISNHVPAGNRNVKFRNLDHDRRYLRMLNLLDLLEDMTDAEFTKHQQRLQRRQEAEKTTAPSLFDTE